MRGVRRRLEKVGKVLEGEGENRRGGGGWRERRGQKKRGIYRGEPAAVLYFTPARRRRNSSFVTKGDQT
jgi:hypothetical protein